MPRAYRSPACAVTLLLALAAPRLGAEEPAKLYAAKCQACHGVDGQSPFPEFSLADDKWLHGSSVAEITKVITDGVPGKAMLPFKEQLTKAEIGALAKHVKSFSRKSKPQKGAASK
jgi:mono/diheme cytochrome c family protein